MIVSIVTIKNNKRRVQKRFSNSKDLKEYWKSIKNKKYKFYTINHTIATAPPESYYKSNSSYLWCPYCRGPRDFIKNEILEVNRCKICRISERDFYVRKFNGIR